MMNDPHAPGRITEQAPSSQEAWTFGTAAPAEPPRRSRGLAFGAIGLVLILVAGFLVWQFSRSDSGNSAAASISLAFKQGDTSRYSMHMTMDGALDDGSTGLGQQPVTLDVTQTVSWNVATVDADGTATVEVTVEDMSGTVNGQPVPSTGAGVVTRIRVAPDGRILSAGNLAFSSTAESGGASFPGMGQITPLLPDHPVAPGDSWQKSFEQDFPFGDGQIRFTSQSTFDRYEDVNGTKAAVITSNISVPLDFTVDFGKLLAAVGGASEAGGEGAAQLKRATITYGGNGRFTITSWLDLANKDVLKSSTDGNFDMTMEFSGLPNTPPGGRFAFKGKFTQDITRL